MGAKIISNSCARGKTNLKKKWLSLILSIIISTLPYTTVSNEGNEIEKDYHQPIEKLQWLSPNGELPSTYKEYIEAHPLKRAIFSAPRNNDCATQSLDPISLLIDSTLYSQIVTGINQYVIDLESEESSVFIETVSGGTPKEIKDWIRQRYNSGCKSFVLIGDITSAWAEVSGAVFPCDLFYMDLDGKWEDTDRNGVYEKHSTGSGNMGPEVYVGRIYAHTLNYDTEANMVNDYLSKIHAYRYGELTQPWRGLEYVDEDWYDMNVHLDLIYGRNVTRYDQGYYTTEEDYLNQMDLGQHFVQVCAHSYSGGHYFSTKPTESASYAHVYVYSPIDRAAKLLLGCDDGIKIWLNGNNVYTNDRYGGWIADWYKIDVNLNAGWNRLLCKVSQSGGEYKFSVRFTDTDLNTFDDLEYQINNPEAYAGSAPFIRSWLLNGFHQDISDNFYEYLTTNYLDTNEASIDPNEGDSMGGKTWTRYDSGNPYVDMGEYSNDADFGVCYAYVNVYANTKKTCQLWMGYDDGARAWLNGEEIVYDNRYGGFEADVTKVDVTLTAGANRLLVKISEWMGGHGFAARFCKSDGSEVDGITYNPEPTPITYIGTWLINGPYLNPDETTRLKTDYLDGENTVTPSENDSAPHGTWDRGIGDGCPFNLASFFDEGDWVYSETIQQRDPPVLFYNLFSCGPGRFTDDNYLAGSYIFHTTYGLITMASAKSGSMLYFDDFTDPLGEGKSIGDAFHEWFDAQAPFALWEKEWYYGMVLCGDPTLHIFKGANSEPHITITKPNDAIYFKDSRLMSFFTPTIIGEITIEACITNEGHGIDHVDFFVDEGLISMDDEYPYECPWDEKIFGQHTLKVIAYDNNESETTDEVEIIILNLDII